MLWILASMVMTVTVLWYVVTSSSDKKGEEIIS
jgi:hypothetical protein